MTDKKQLEALLKSVASGKTSVEEAALQLREIPYDDLSSEDRERFIAASLLSCKDSTAPQALAEWTKNELTEDDIQDIRAKNNDILKDVEKISTHPLYHIAVKHGASKYLLDKLSDVLSGNEAEEMTEAVSEPAEMDAEEDGEKEAFSYVHDPRDNPKAMRDIVEI